MKKILFSLAVILGGILSAQGTINIFNYTTSFNLSNSLVAYNSTSPGCYPSISGTNHPVPVPSGGSVQYTNFNTTPADYPPINTWTIYSATGAPSVQTPFSPILSVLSGTTTWQLNKFSLSDPTGAPVPYGGATIGVIGCGTPLVSTISPTPAIPYPFQAFWFIAGGQTYFIVQ